MESYVNNIKYLKRLPTFQYTICVGDEIEYRKYNIHQTRSVKSLVRGKVIDITKSSDPTDIPSVSTNSKCSPLGEDSVEGQPEEGEVGSKGHPT